MSPVFGPGFLHVSVSLIVHNPPLMEMFSPRKFYAVEDFDIVFESSYEMFFWAICTVAKVRIERFDRQHGVAWKENGWYAPDFWLPSLGIAVELKGVPDENDDVRWARFRDSGTPLVVWLQDNLWDLSAQNVLNRLQG